MDFNPAPLLNWQHIQIALKSLVIIVLESSLDGRSAGLSLLSAMVLSVLSYLFTWKESLDSYDTWTENTGDKCVSIACQSRVSLKRKQNRNVNKLRFCFSDLKISTRKKACGKREPQIKPCQEHNDQLGLITYCLYLKCFYFFPSSSYQK